MLFSGAGWGWAQVGFILLVMAVVAMVPRRLPEGWMLVEAVVEHTRRRLGGVIVVMVIGMLAGGVLTLASLLSDDTVVSVLVAGLLLLLASLGGLVGSWRERRDAATDLRELLQVLHERPTEVTRVVAMRSGSLGMLGAGIVHGVEIGAADGHSWTLLGRPSENRAVVAFLRTVCPQVATTER